MKTLETLPSDTYDSIVLGAGISGLVSASILSRSGRSVIVVDEFDRLGGNHIDCKIGDYTFDVGTFIFQDDSPLLNHFPELLPIYVPIEPQFGRLTPQGRITKYPISLVHDFLAAGPLEWLRILSSVLISRAFRRRLQNARDFADYWIGRRMLHRSGLGAYVERFYGRPPEDIDLDFAQKRMGWLRENGSIRSYLGFRRWFRQVRGPQNTQLARPAEGFARLYQAAEQRLSQFGVTFLLGAKLHRLTKQDDVFVLDLAGRQLAAKRLVSTIPLERMRELCGIKPRYRLESVTLISLFMSFSGERGFPQSVLFNFSYEGAWKRLTVYSDFYGRRHGREYFAVEVNALHVGGSAERAEANFREHVSKNGLFRGDLRLEGSRLTENAYPVYADKAAERAARAICELREFGVESIGKQGGFDYQPTARASTAVAEAALA